MTPHHLSYLFTAFALMISGAMAPGQVPIAANPEPKAGVMIEPVQGNGGPESKFTNSTDGELGIQYGKSKFLLRPGEVKRIPIPPRPLFDLKIFEKRPADDRLIPRFDGKATPNAKKRFIHFPWAKANKKEEGKEAAP